MNRAFRLLWCASTLSALGDGIRYVSLPLIASASTSDPRIVSLVFVAGYLAWPLFGLVGGAVADRFDRRRLMWTIDLARAVLVAALAISIVTDDGSIGVLLVVTLLIGIAETVFDSAASAIVPEIVEPHLLEQANSWIFSAQTAASTLVGAIVGALLFGLGHQVPLIVDAACFFMAALLIRAMPRSRAKRVVPAERQTISQDIRTGLSWLVRDRLLRTICGLVMVMNAVIAAAEAVLVLYAREVLDLAELGYAALLATLAVASVVGGLATPTLRGIASLRTVLSVGAIGMGAAVIVAGVTSSIPATFVALVVAGLASGTWNVTAVTARQQHVPIQLLGRVTSAYRTVGLTAMPIGAGMAGLLAERFGLHTPFLVGGVVLVAAAAVSAPLLAAVSPTDQRTRRRSGPDEAAGTR